MRDPIVVTPDQIKALSPCAGRWAVYRKVHPGDDAHPLSEVIDSNGLDDALWVLDRLPGMERHRVVFAAWCAAQVLHLFERDCPDDMRPRQAIATARAWAQGEASDPELAAAGAAAWAAAWPAARDAAWPAARSAAWSAARSAAGSAARSAARSAAWAAAWPAAWYAAWDAAWERQSVALRRFLNGEEPPQ